ncbi:MAG: 50S ribosomal protein L28 [Oligoflexia bacterium]|nr:50S ribosomal protein L28 [Oligoflexia bacterium]
MAQCYYCSKHQMVGNKVSHSNIKTKTRNLPNVQKIKALVGKRISRVYACTRCIRSGKVTRPTPRSTALALNTAAAN